MKTLTTWAATIALAASGAFSCAFAHDIRIGEISVSQPYARAMLPGAKVGGGYLTITNEAATNDRLVSATASRAGSVQLHEMKFDNGVMVMRELEGGITVPAGTTVELKPGGYHVMFMDVQQPFKEGEDIRATLTFERAGSIEVDFTVGPPAGNGGHGKHEGHGK